MRKAIKIKVFILFVAWLTIFVHSIIPHNHIEENHGCQYLVHYSHETSVDQDGSVKLLNQPENIKVCHLSGLLFQNPAPENLLLHTTGIVSILSYSPGITIIFDPVQNIITGISPSFVSLRAPPSV